MVQALLANSMVQPLWCKLYMQTLWCKLYCAISMVQAQGEMYIAYYALQHYITTVA